MTFSIRFPSPAVAGAILLVATAFAGCDEEPTGPGQTPSAMVDMTTVTFAEADPALGSIEQPVVTLSNDGEAELVVDEVSLQGADAASFSIVEGGDAPFTVAAGASHGITLAFTPSEEGSLNASLAIETNDPARPGLEVAISAVSTRFQYAQVDRMGIPALNTVFNHPSGIAGFDKVAYNVASPSDDVATYRDQFVTVLEAVGNADPEATADLLLPDELPVAMGVSQTSFAELTGRAPSDDATDVALVVTVGVESLQSDRVPSNDVPFLEEFPYLAQPHP